MSIPSRFVDYLRKQRRTVAVEYRKALISLLEENPSSKLLDCGWGDGEFTLIKNILPS